MKTSRHIAKAWFLVAAIGILTLGFVVRAAEKSTHVHAGPEKVVDEGDKAQPVARIGERFLTVGEIERRINAQIPFVRKRYANEEEMKKFVEATVDFEILALEARKLGIDKNQEVVDAAKRVMIHRQRQLIIETRVSLEQITDDEVNAYYEKHLVEFQRPERRRVGIIVVADEAKAKQLRAEVDKNSGDLRAFQQLVKDNSIDEDTKSRGGLLPFFEKEGSTIEKSIVDATFGMTKAGDVAGPVKVDKGFAILRLSGISPAVDKKVAEVSDQLKRRILTDRQQKEFQRYLEELRAKANIRINREKLALVKVDTSAGHGPGGDFHQPGGPQGMPPRVMPPQMPGGPKMRPAVPGPHGHDHGPAGRGPAVPGPAPAPGPQPQ